MSDSKCLKTIAIPNWHATGFYVSSDNQVEGQYELASLVRIVGHMVKEGHRTHMDSVVALANMLEGSGR